MRRVLLSPRAEADIVDIAAHTLANWGERQMARYVGGLDHRLGVLAAHPESGRRRTEIGSDYRSAVYGSHVIFYRVRTADILVVRVLHARMNPDRHLP